MSDIDDLEKALRNAREAFADPVERNRRVFNAEQKLYRAQKKEFEASIKRRAKLQKAKP